MKFSVQLPTDRVEGGLEFTSNDAIAEMSEAIEAAGFDACSPKMPSLPIQI